MEKAVFKPWPKETSLKQKGLAKVCHSRRLYLEGNGWKWYDHDWVLEAEGIMCPKIACNTGYEAIGMAQIRRCLPGEVRKLSLVKKGSQFLQHKMYK